MTKQKQIDFTSLLLDVINYTSKKVLDFGLSIDKNEIAEKYASNWAKIFKEKFEHETAVQWSNRYYEHLNTFLDAQVLKLASEMSGKVAKLVTFSVTIRVVVDKNEMKEVEEEDAIKAAIERIKKDGNPNIEHWICFDNNEGVYNDEDCPFNPIDDILNPDLMFKLRELQKRANKYTNDPSLTIDTVHSILEYASNLYADKESVLIKERVPKLYATLYECNKLLTQFPSKEETNGYDCIVAALKAINDFVNGKFV